MQKDTRVCVCTTIFHDKFLFDKFTLFAAMMLTQSGYWAVYWVEFTGTG